MNARKAMYTNLTLTIDTRENKSPERIQHITDFFLENGGTVKFGTVDFGDYHIIGTFPNKNKENKYVDLIIEYKEVNDFCATYKTLQERFADSCKEYDHVALFIEGKIQYQMNEETKNVYIKNTIGEVGPDDNKFSMAECCSIFSYHHNIHEFEREGVTVEHLLHMGQFGPTLNALLYYLVNYPYTGITLKEQDPRKVNYAMYAQVNNIGAKTVEKISHKKVKYWLDHPDELKKVAGKQRAAYLLEAWGFNDA